MNPRHLLRLYPRAWRERYGEELVELAGPDISWRVAMDIAASGLKERFSGEGYAPAGFVWLAVRLAAAFVAFWTVGTVVRVVDFLVRSPGRPLTGNTLQNLIAWRGAATFAEMWLIFSLFSLLLAVLANGFGWRESRPRVASALVRFGVCSWMLAWTVAKELPAHFHVSPYSQLGVAMMLFAALIVGFVVDSAGLGRAARPATQS